MDGTIVSEWEFERMYEDMLDDCYGTVEVAGMTYDTSHLLKNVDPIAFEVGMADYANALMEDEEGLIIEGYV